MKSWYSKCLVCLQDKELGLDVMELALEVVDLAKDPELQHLRGVTSQNSKLDETLAVVV